MAIGVFDSKAALHGERVSSEALLNPMLRHEYFEYDSCEAITEE